MADQHRKYRKKEITTCFLVENIKTQQSTRNQILLL